MKNKNNDKIVVSLFSDSNLREPGIGGQVVAQLTKKATEFTHESKNLRRIFIRLWGDNPEWSDGQGCYEWGDLCDIVIFNRGRD